MADVIQKIFDIQVNYDGVAKKLVELTEANTKLADSEKALKKEYKNGNIQTAQYAQAIANITQQKKKNTEQINKYTQAFQREIESQSKEIEKVEKLRQKLFAIGKAYMSLSDSVKQSKAGDIMRKQMVALATSIRTATEEIAKSTATLGASSTSINGMKAEIEDLRKKYMNLSKTERESKNGKDLLAQIKQNTSAYNEQIRVLKNATIGFNQNADSVNALREKLKALYAQYDELSKKERQGGVGRALTDDIDRTRKEIEKAEQATGRYQRNVGNYLSVFKGFGMRVLNVVGAVTTVAQAWVKFGDAIKQSISDTIEYNREISKLTAIMQESKSNIAMLSAEAKRLGATTRYTATEVAQLQVELAKLGYTKSEIMVMSESVLNLAQATGANLADAAALAGAALRVFGDDATQLTKYVDQMATATSKSALSFDYIKTALPIVGGAADMFGFKLQDTLALLGQLANSGMEASMAATATRNIFLKLADSSGVLNQQLGKPVESLEDLLSGLEELRAKGANLNDALEMTNVRAAVAFTRFLNSTKAARELAKSMNYAAKSEDELREEANKAGITVQELRKQMEICNGTAKDMAEIMEDNLGGDITRLKSAWDDYMLSLLNGQGPLRWAVEKVRELVSYLGDIARTVEESSNQQTSNALQNYVESDEFKNFIDYDIKLYEAKRDKLVAEGMSLNEAMAKAQVSTLEEIDKNTNNVLSVIADSYKRTLDAKRKEFSQWADSSYELLIRERDRLKKNIENEGILDPTQSLAVYGQTLGNEEVLKNSKKTLADINTLIDAWDRYSEAQAKVEAQENRKQAFSNRANKEDNKSGLGIEDDAKKNKRLSREKSAAKALLDAQIAYENSLLKIRKDSAKKQLAAIDYQYKHEIERLQYKITEELKMRGDESEKERADKLAAIAYYQDTITNKNLEWSQESARLTYEWVKKEYEYTKELYALKLDAMSKGYGNEEAYIKKEYEMRRALLEREEASEVAALEAMATKDERIEQEKQERLIAIRKKYANKRLEMTQKEREDLANMVIRNTQAEQEINVTDQLKVLELKQKEAEAAYQSLQGEAAKRTYSDSELALKEAQAWNALLAAIDAVSRKKIELATQQMELDAVIRQSDTLNEFGENTRIANELERAESEVEISKTKYEAILEQGRLAMGSEQEFQARKAQAYADYVQKRETLANKELDIAQAVVSGTVGGFAQIAQAIGDASDANRDAVKAAKLLGLAEIWINNGIAIAKATATQSQGDPYTMFARIAAAIAQVTASTISAVSALNKAKFAKGAVNIQGPGTGTSDSINARISRGESVMTAKATKMFGTLLTIMNDVAAQPNVTLPTQYATYNPMQTSVESAAMTESMKEAVAEIRPVVTVTDIEDATRRVNTIKVLDTV